MGEDISKIEYKKKSNGFTVKGKPEIIEFEESLNNVYDFVNYLADSSFFFLLYHKINDNYFGCSGVTEEGSKFDLEISSGFIRFYRKEGCSIDFFKRFRSFVKDYEED